LIVDAIGMKMFCRGSTLDSRIFLAAEMEFVMTMMLWILSLSMAGIRLVWMVISSALMGDTFMEWT